MTTVAKRGRLTIFLGYAAGVGKTYQMLTEARALREQGVDIVVAYFEPHGRRETIALVEGLEMIPRRTIEYKGSRLEEMDTDAVLRRHPQVAVVDEFPHTNVPGSPRAKRWEDVRVMIEAGIDVLTTMNIQHVESLHDQIWQSTGVRVRETIPDWVVKQADEVVMVDLTPGALLSRLERGVVYPPDRARAALQNFFREPTLVALRELAMRQTAYSIENRQRAPEGAPDTPAALPAAERARERLLLVIEPNPASAALIRRGRRVADYLHADCLGVYVGDTADLRHLSHADRDRLQRHLSFARALQIETHVLTGTDVAATLVAFARQQRVTQVFVLHNRDRTLRRWLTEGLVQQIVNLAQDMQVTVVADRTVRKRSA